MVLSLPWPVLSPPSAASGSVPAVDASDGSEQPEAELHACVLDPAHAAPPLDGAGLVHDRVCVHVFALQLPHSFQPPLTGTENKRQDMNKARGGVEQGGRHMCLHACAAVCALIQVPAAGQVQ